MINPLRCFRKTITFDGVTNGAVGTITVATTTGAILIERGGALCSTLLTGSGTIELGVASNTAALIAQTTGTDLDANEFWQDASPELGVSAAIVDKCVKGNIILTVASATITAGVIEFCFYYRPLTSDGYIT